MNSNNMQDFFGRKVAATTLWVEMDRTIYRLGAELLSVRQFLERQPEQAGLYHALQAMTSSVEVTGLRTRPPGNPDDKFIAEIALGLLCRGWPTLSSPFVEKSLVFQQASSLGLRALRGRAHEVAWELHGDETSVLTAGKAAARALLPTDEGLKPRDEVTTWQGDSITELRFFQAEMERDLGPLRACVEWQRSLETMVKNPVQRARVAKQRADFTLELGPVDQSGPRVLLDLEIDGPFRHPIWRDSILKSEGWIPFRIPVEDLKIGWKLPTEADLLKSLSQHPVFISRHDAPIALGLDQRGMSARSLLLIPHAIARIQLAVLLAIRNGALSLRQPEWRLLVREREVPSARLAITDLTHLLVHLSRLCGVKCTYRPVIAIIADHCERVPADTSRRVYLETLETQVGAARPEDFDLAIDVSVLCRSTQAYPDEYAEGGWTRLRTAPSTTLATALEWSSPREITEPLTETQALRYFLQTCFRKRSFRDGQLPIIERALHRQSVIGLLPTGAGKSLTYQLPALITPGHVFIVDPIKSLMQDQVENLREVGISSAVTINSDLQSNEREIAERAMAAGDFRFIFISPERLQIETFRTYLAKLCTRSPVSFAVIDEAHCVSEWGHDFRPAYLNLGRNARKFFKYGQFVPPIIALTGTASRQVLIDVRREKEVEDDKAIIEPKSHNRPELRYEIVRSHSQEKRNALLLHFNSLLERLSNAGCTSSPEELRDGSHGGIVFCSFVGSDFGIERVETILTPTDWGTRAGIYCGKIPRSRGFLKTTEWNNQKSRTQSDFKQNKLSVLIATNAFGMGIDKSNIRYTVHFGTPKSLEALAQEAGRAGRDGENSLCTILFSTHLPKGADDPLEERISTEEAKRRLAKVRRNERDDALRSMYLHFLSYPGVDAEATDIDRFFHYRLKDRLSSNPPSSNSRETSGSTKSLLRSLVDSSEQRGSGRNEGVADSDDDAGLDPVVDLGKIVHRLSLLGVVRDYTVEYYSEEDRTYTLELEPLDEPALLINLRAYVERYDRVHAWPTVESDYHDTEGESVTKAIWALTRFMYRAVEVRRREAMRNVREVLSNAQGGNDLKRAIDDYFSTATFGPHLAKALGEESAAKAVHDVVQNVTSLESARQLLGQTLRALESDPNNPSLRVISGIARASVDNPIPADAAFHLMSGFNAAFDQTQTIPTELIDSTLSELASVALQTLDDVVVEALNLETRATPDIADYIAVSAFNLVSLPHAYRRCANRVADQLALASKVSPALGKAGSVDILASLDSGNAELKHRHIETLLTALGSKSSSGPSGALAYRLFAECAFSNVSDAAIKHACAATILRCLRQEAHLIV